MRERRFTGFTALRNNLKVAQLFSRDTQMFLGGDVFNCFSIILSK